MVHFGQCGHTIGPLRSPVRVVPEYECTLFFGFPEYLHNILLVQLIYIFHKDGIEVTGRHVSGNLRSWNDQQLGAFCSLQGQFITPVPIWVRYILLMWLVLNMIGNGNHIQSIPESLLDPDTGPHIPVGKHRMHMQVTFQGQIAGNIRKFYGTGVFFGMLFLP